MPGSRQDRGLSSWGVTRKKKIVYQRADSHESNVLRTRFRRGGNSARCHGQATSNLKRPGAPVLSPFVFLDTRGSKEPCCRFLGGWSLQLV